MFSMLSMFDDVNTESKALDKELSMNCLNCYWHKECEAMSKDTYLEACDEFLPDIITCSL